MAQKNTTLDDLATVIGFSATVKLAAWFGGLNVFIPDTVEVGQTLERLIGMSAAKRLSQEWGRCHVAVPPLHAYEDEVQRRVIGRMLERGFGVREISRHNRMGERRVQQICRELETAGLIEIVVPRKPGRPAKTPQENPGSISPTESLQEKPGGKVGGGLPPGGPFATVGPGSVRKRG